VFHDQSSHEKGDNNNKEADLPVSFPPFFEFLAKLRMYEKDIKIISCGLVMIISICFLIPVVWLWVTNFKASMKSLTKENKRPYRRYYNASNNNHSLYSNSSKFKEQDLSDEEENLMKTRA
jgi:hypothetical protein